MSRNYVNPPIIEAVCEFRLTPDSKWDLSIPGLIYEKVRKDFPNKEQRHFFQELEIVQSPQGLQQRIGMDERILFLTNDRKMFLQVGSNLLAVNCLKPYAKWSGFKPRIENAFNMLKDTVDVKGLQRIGLRYINRIEIPTQLVKLEDYFEFHPFLGKRLPQNMSGFSLRCLLPFFGGRDVCTVQLINAVPEKKDSSAFILDLDYFLNQPQAISVNQTLDWIEKAHQQIEEVFEGCITQHLRETFQEVK
jgi:uncharacterized protein (TIGR04255 family)